MAFMADLDRDQPDRVTVGRASAIAEWPTTPLPPVRLTTLTGLLEILLQDAGEDACGGVGAAASAPTAR